MAAPAILRTGLVSAQTDYPSRPITCVSTNPAGSGADSNVRNFVQLVSKRLGQPIVVENRTGAAGIVGAQYVANAKPDGYTILAGPGQGLLSIAPYLYKSVPYSAKDFQSITTLYTQTLMLIVAASSPYKKLEDLTAALRTKGEQASYGSYVPAVQICGELYKSVFGLPTAEVKYRSTESAIIDLQAGLIEFLYTSMASATTNVNAGVARALVCAATKRSPFFPDIPGSAESGIPYNVEVWASVHAPANTPVAIVDKLEQAFNEAVASPEAREFLKAQGQEPLPGNRKMLDEMLAHDLVTWGEFAKIAKIEKI
jgi:tripartite-type tricarboxylate transporter receptor subunit TctC